MKWEYRVVRFAAQTKPGVDHAEVVAYQLHQLMTAQMADGFEYYRLDHVTLYELPGCIGRLFGSRAQSFGYDVAVFRRPLG